MEINELIVSLETIAADYFHSDRLRDRNISDILDLVVADLRILERSPIAVDTKGLSRYLIDVYRESAIHAGFAKSYGDSVRLEIARDYYGFGHLYWCSSTVIFRRLFAGR